MTDNQLLTTTQRLITIESTAHNPAGLQQAYDYMVEFVRGYGKNITIEHFKNGDVPSFLAYKGPRRPQKFHLLFNGHLDVVPGAPKQYRPEIKDGKLYGRGAYDMKAACVAMIDIFCETVDKTPFNFGLQIVTDEESNGERGTLYQIQQGVRSDFVISGDCGRRTGTYELANCAKGVIVVEICFSGKSTHGAYPWNGDNAAMRAHRFIHALHERYPTPAVPTDNSTVTVIGVAAGGDAHTRTPDRATVKLNARYVHGDPYLSDVAKFTAFVKELDPGAKILTFHCFSSPFYTQPDNLQLQRLLAAAQKVEGKKFRLVQRHGTSDARFYGDVGIAACEFGIAGEDQHGDDEHITLKAFNDYRKTLRLFLENSIEAEVTTTTKAHAIA